MDNHSAEFFLRRFNPKKDTRTLKKWIGAPHVQKWWGNPEDQLNEILSGLSGGEQSIIMADGSAIGYLQWEKISRDELDSAGLNDIPEGVIDIDIAIGDVQYTGKGIGPRVLEHLIQTRLRRMRAPMIVMSTSIDNLRARRAFEKAGFIVIREFLDPRYGKMMLLEWINRITTGKVRSKISV